MEEYGVADVFSKLLILEATHIFNNSNSVIFLDARSIAWLSKI